MSGSDEYALLIDLDSREAKPIAETSLADLKLLERQNLQLNYGDPSHNPKVAGSNPAPAIEKPP